MRIVATLQTAFAVVVCFGVVALLLDEPWAPKYLAACAIPALGFLTFWLNHDLKEWKVKNGPKP